MDELVIGDKKYISSKRAAEVTGYAKDYIGQLCREGRVEARLVGRSWYVLDSAIQDHRFSKNEVINQVNKGQNDESVGPYEAPHYIAEPIIPIPTVTPREESVAPEPEKADFVPKIQEVWQEWFSNRTEIEAIVEEEEPQIEESPAVEPEIEENEASVELTFNKIAVEEPIYRVEPQNEPIKHVRAEPRAKSSRRGYYALRAILAVISVIAVGIAIINSGKIEASALKYIPGSIAGITDYSAGH